MNTILTVAVTARLDNIWPVWTGMTVLRILLVIAGYYCVSTVYSNNNDLHVFSKYSADILGYWKHFNLSAETLNYRNMRGKSPIITRELDRYVGSTHGADFRHYNYRKVPYFGGSDDYK